MLESRDGMFLRVSSVQACFLGEAIRTEDRRKNQDRREFRERVF